MQIGNFLSEQIKGNNTLRLLVSSLVLRYLDVDKFKAHFGEMSPDEMAQFILDSNNAYELGKWSDGERHTNSSMYERGYGLNGVRQRRGHNDSYCGERD